jgi:hypothetical protein
MKLGEIEKDKEQQEEVIGDDLCHSKMSALM